MSVTIRSENTFNTDFQLNVNADVRGVVVGSDIGRGNLETRMTTPVIRRDRYRGPFYEFFPLTRTGDTTNGRSFTILNTFGRNVRPSWLASEGIVSGAEYDSILTTNRARIWSPTVDDEYIFRSRDIVVALEVPVVINNGLNEEQIMSCLDPTEYYGQSSEEDVCPVCLEMFIVGQEVSNLRCNHIFHVECIKPWLMRNRRCPMCRTNAMVETPE